MTVNQMSDLIDEYARHLQTRGCAASTVETYVQILQRLHRELSYGIDAANADELQTWIFGERDRSAATHKLYRAAICGYYRWACGPLVGELEYDPTVLLPPVSVPRRTPRPIPAGQLADILTRAAQPYRTWYLLAAGEGLRCVEIAALDREHITAESTWVHGKGSHERMVPTHPRVWEVVRTLPPGSVVRAADGGRATRRQVKDRGNHHLRHHLEQPDVTMHRFRHTFATLVYRATGDPFLVQRLLGHASVATTQVYAAVASSALSDAVAALTLPGASAGDGSAGTVRSAGGPGGGGCRG